MDIDHIAAEEMPRVKERIMAKKDELGLLMLELSARAQGYHLVFRRKPELSQEENLKWASELLEVEFDKGAKDITRVFFTTTEEELIYLDNEIFETTESISNTDLTDGMDGACKKTNTDKTDGTDKAGEKNPSNPLNPCSNNKKNSCSNKTSSFKGIPYSSIISEYWRRTGGEPQEGERNVKLYQLAVNLRAICDNKKEVLMDIMPRFGLSDVELKSVVDSACKEPPKGISKVMKEIIGEALKEMSEPLETEEDDPTSNLTPHPSNLKMPQGIRDSIAAVGPQLAMPVLTAICPCIGTLATGVVLDVHGQKKGLNLISYIAGDFASGKGQIDPVVEAWMSELMALDKMYQMQEDEWRAKKRAAKNKKEQPEEPKLPVRCLTLNNTVANLAERLANTEGKHAFSFTPEADTVAQKWKTTMSDFSVMLRQSYDGTKYEREARSAEAVNVHIEHLLWNVVMCGTPDAL